MTLQKDPATSALRTGQRLAKRVAAMLPCSRREAEQYIEGGWVRVDGQVVEEPMFRVSNQKLEIDPQASLLELTAVTLLLHKPPGYDTMATPGEASTRVKAAQQLLGPDSHAADDASGVRVLTRHFAKLSACLPLESTASGLVVFTQDWRVLRKLREDANTIEQEMIVEVAGAVTDETLRQLNQTPAAGNQTRPGLRVSVNSANPGATRLRFAIKGIQPDLIAHLCERAGLSILGVKRLRIGRVAMTALPVGQWRYLQGHERF